jgi:ATP-binding cassette, subfamily B, heavy metal transporter
MGVPLVLKQLLDGMSIRLTDPKAFLMLPIGILIAYGALRLATTLFTDSREIMFAKVAQRALRSVALCVFQHLHALSLRFHLDRQTGG